MGEVSGRERRGETTSAGARTGRPVPAEPELVFSDIATLELDELLSQLAERAQEVRGTQVRLRGLLTATRAVSADLSLPDLLRSIVEAACELVGARYGALGVIGGAGGLVEFITVGMDEETVAHIGDPPHGNGVLGVLIDDPRPLRMVDLTEHPRSSGFPARHPPMHSFVGVPLRVRNEVFGNLYLTEKQGGAEFTAADEELLAALASSAGVAIQNARLYEAATLRERWSAASAEIAHDLLRGGPDPYRLVASRARDVADADLAAVLLTEPDEPDVLRVVVAEGAGGDGLTGTTVPVDRSRAAAALRDDRDLLLDDAGRVSGSTLPSGPGLALRLDAVGRTPSRVLTLVRHAGRVPYSADELAMAATFARHVGLALELARAHDQARRLAVLEDRDRIARDLHASVVHEIFAAGLELQSAAKQTDGETARLLTKLVAVLDDTLATIRESVFELRSRGEPV